ncbi:MAG: putative metal-binding motif-containing protein [Alphaproteobacteria bacterium]|nr:putative metal-binding motif-containing protein [Alphaproteobacteria bacterium]
MGNTLRWLPLLATLAACGPTGVELIDQDGDGWYLNDPNPEYVDCNDTPVVGLMVRPKGQAEVCDGLDNDCDGVVDEDDAEGALEWWPDDDEDGFGKRVENPKIACNLPRGYSANRKDCNDSDPFIYPNAPERCNALDDDCDIDVDEGFDLDAIWHADADRDGYGSLVVVGTGCAEEAGWVRTATDCNDFNARVHPEAAEICDGIDNDCDRLIDQNDPDVTGTRTWFADDDGDGYGTLLTTQDRCWFSPPGEGWVSNDDDCNDADPLQSPESIWYRDADHDGFGKPGVTWPLGAAEPTPQCWQPIGFALNQDDCDDTDPESFDTALWFADADSDGYGFPLPVWQGCGRQPGWVSRAGDCADHDPTRNPDVLEVCDGIDNDCDNLIDDADDSVADPQIWFRDNDQDGYGVNFAAVESCEAPTGFAAQLGDCDDNDPRLNPGTVWYRDADRDGYGDPANPSAATTCDVVPGHVPNADDCDDTDYYRNDYTPWYPDMDGDGLGIGNVVVDQGCLDGTEGIAPETGDCNDDDPLENGGGCFGPALGMVSVVAHVDRDYLGFSLRMVCDNFTAFTQFPYLMSAADRSTTVTRTDIIPAFDTCQFTLSGPGSDFSGDGLWGADVVVCGQTIGTVVGGGRQSPRFEIPRCSGCTDPAATNYDPTAIISTNAESCLY